MRKTLDKAKQIRAMQRAIRRAAMARTRREALRKWKAGNSARPRRERLPFEARQLEKLVAPPRLNFNENAESTARFLADFRQKMCRPKGLRVDLRPVVELSPECAIVMLSSIAHTLKYDRSSPRSILAPKSEHVNEMLRKIGFYDLLPKFYRRFERLNNLARTFAHYQSGDLVNPTPIAETVELFGSVMGWSRQQERVVYIALIECLTNVLGHAYPPNKEPSWKWIRNRWWLMGHFNPNSREIWLCVYDCGVGIPETIRTRFKDQLWILSPSDEELIVQAVMEGRFSRTKVPTRGKGLPTLRAFVTDAKAGELKIASGRSLCTFREDGRPVQRQLDTGIDGTLIVWTLKKRIE